MTEPLPTWRLPPDEIRSRVVRMAQLVRAAGMDVGIVACRNVDRRELPPESIVGMPIPLPTVAHTLNACECCGTAVWIGPAQLERKQRNATTDIVLCFLCSALLTGLGVEYSSVVLNADIDSLPKRNV